MSIDLLSSLYSRGERQRSIYNRSFRIEVGHSDRSVILVLQ